MNLLDLDPVTINGYTYKRVRASAEIYVEGGGVALALWCDEEGYWEPLATLTINVEGDPRLGPKVWARDSEENSGIVSELEAQGLVRTTGEVLPSGYIELIEVELTGAFLDLLESLEARR